MLLELNSNLNIVIECQLELLANICGYLLAKEPLPKNILENQWRFMCRSRCECVCVCELVCVIHTSGVLTFFVHISLSKKKKNWHGSYFFLSYPHTLAGGRPSLSLFPSCLSHSPFDSRTLFGILNFCLVRFVLEITFSHPTLIIPIVFIGPNFRC